MSTPSRGTARTVATIVALGLAGTGLAAPATAAPTPAPKAKNIVLRANQYPRLIDNPGDEHDVIRFTKVAGVEWSLNGEEVDFAGAATTDLDAVKGTATLTKLDDDAATRWILPTGTPTEWDFDPTNENASPVNVDAITAIWNDAPAAKNDTVTITKVTGVQWTVTTGSKTATYDPAAFGARTTLTLPATAATPATPATPATVVKPELLPGYELGAQETLPAVDNTLTASSTVAYEAEVLNDLVEVGENPLDRTKGYGPGAGRETVRVTGAAGLKWKIGSLSAKAVKGVAYLPVDPDDIVDGEVTVTPVAARGYSVPAGYTATVEFKDEDTPPRTVVGDKHVKVNDASGATKDTIVFTTLPGVTWWAGQAGRNGKIAYTPVRAAKNGTATYRVVHPARGVGDTSVFIKPVANRGYDIDTTNLTKSTFDFSRDTSTVNRDNVVLTDTDATFTPHDGIVSWQVRYEDSVGTRSVRRAVTVRAADVVATGATSMAIPFPSKPTLGTTRLLPNYRLG